MRQEAYKKSHEMLVRLFSSPGFHHPAVLQGRRRLFADGHNPHISVRAELEILGGFIVRLAVRQIFFDLIKRNHICNGSCLIEEAAVLIQLIHTFVEEDDAVFQDRELGKRPVGEIKGARLGYALISNHAFVDGNKRIGIYIMLTFLEMNGIRIQCTDEELVHIALSVADGSMKYDELLQWVRDHE